MDTTVDQLWYITNISSVTDVGLVLLFRILFTLLSMASLSFTTCHSGGKDAKHQVSVALMLQVVFIVCVSKMYFEIST